MTTTKETKAETLARIQSGFSKNDQLVIMAYGAIGLEVTPRVDVLTYRAWNGAGRQVAKGAKSLRVTVWIPCTTKDDDAPDGKRQFVRPKDVSLFHVSQTLPMGAAKGTRPAAWNDPALIAPGTYTDDGSPIDHSTTSTEAAEL